MIERTVLNYLDSTLEVPVYMEEPDHKPEQYIIIQKTGSQRVNRLDTATLAIQSIAGTLYEAAVLNESVKQIMEQLPYSAGDVFRAALNGDYNFTDEETKERRYQAVFQITYKE